MPLVAFTPARADLTAHEPEPTPVGAHPLREAVIDAWVAWAERRAYGSFVEALSITLGLDAGDAIAASGRYAVAPRTGRIARVGFDLSVREVDAVLSALPTTLTLPRDNPRAAPSPVATLPTPCRQCGGLGHPKGAELLCGACYGRGTVPGEGS